MRLTQILARVEALRSDVRGQDLVEYALLTGFVAVACGAIFPTSVAPSISTIFSKILSGLQWTPNG